MMTRHRKLKYLGYSIVFQEVPNEITLAINISGCPYKCEGCHSHYLWKYEGNYISDDLDFIINQNLDFVTCVCFFGGDQNMEELHTLLKYIKENYKIKTALYSGRDYLEELKQLFNVLDYIKIGSYKENLGGLNSKNTNQRMYIIKSDKSLEDITCKFRNRKGSIV